MRLLDKSRFAPYIIAIASLLIFCGEALAFPSVPYTPPPTMIPPPQPSKQTWADAKFYKWETGEIIKAFQDNGLETVNVKPAYTLAPIAPRESTMFYMPSYGENIGAYLSSYRSEDELSEMKEYYMGMNKDPLSPAWWIFEKDNILLLISGRVPKEKVSQYEKVLNEIDKPH